MSLVIVLLLGTLYRVDHKRRQLQVQLVNDEFSARLKYATDAYVPVKLISNSEQLKAEEFLYEHLEYALHSFNEFIEQHPEMNGRNILMLKNAQELLDKRNSTEQSGAGYPPQGVGSPDP